MAIGRPMPPLILDDVERETLERWVRRPKTAQAMALRARMVLACAEGRSNPPAAGSSHRLGGVRRNGGEVARPVRGTPTGRPVRRAAQRSAACRYR